MSRPALAEAPTTTQGARDATGLPLPPVHPGGLRDHTRALASLHPAGLDMLTRGVPVSYLRFGPDALGPKVALRVALVCSPQGAHDVLAGADGAIDKLSAIHTSFARLSPNVFNLAHEQWLPRKRALQPVFTKPRMVEYAAAISDVATETSEQWAQEGTLDVLEHARSLTCEILGRSLLGRELGSQAGVLSTAFDHMTGYVLWRGITPVTPPLWVPTPGLRRYRAAERDALALCEEALADAATAGADAAPLLRRMLEAVDPETGEPMSQEQRRNDLLTFMMAGHDTTATTLAYSLWQLGRHPEWQEAVAAEAAAIGARTLTPADVDALPVTVRVLHEAMRLCPPGPAIPRQTTRDVAVDGWRIPAGWVVIVNSWALHRDPSAWDDPERFDPDRFTAERSKGRSRWQFIPFGGGQRKCIGDHFAMLESVVALATLVRDLRFTPIDEWDTEFAFTTRSSGPVRMSVERRA